MATLTIRRGPEGEAILHAMREQGISVLCKNYGGLLQVGFDNEFEQKVRELLMQQGARKV